MKICFVCHGNICRSPMAEFVFRTMAKERGVDDRFTAVSRAVSDEEIFGGVGNPVYPPVKALLTRHGIACEGKRACQLTQADYAQYDLLIGMDSSNLRRMRTIVGSDPQGKCCLLRDFSDGGGDIADPWYSRDFELTWQQVSDGCAALLDKLESECVL